MQARMRRLEHFMEFVKVMRPGGFMRHFQMMEGACSYSDAKTMQVEYKVPEAVCEEGAQLPLSTLLAMVDEASSWAHMGIDSHMRPGSSICLSAALTAEKLPGAGDMLLFETTVKKLGKTVLLTPQSSRTIALLATAASTSAAMPPPPPQPPPPPPP